MLARPGRAPVRWLRGLATTTPIPLKAGRIHGGRHRIRRMVMCFRSADGHAPQRRRREKEKRTVKGREVLARDRRGGDGGNWWAGTGRRICPWFRHER